MLTGIVRDNRYLDHMTGHAHPEHPSRLRATYDALDNQPIKDLVPIAADFAKLEELELIHTPTYVKKVMKTAEQTHTSIAPDTPVCAKSYLAAWLAVGGCLRAVDALRDGRCEACFCLVRPPGHHAQADRAGGFCIFNNLAITARYAAGNFNLQRILIIDFDIHHGNGIQEAFEDDPSVLYFSTHDMMLYPFGGDITETGAGAGKGYTVNVPLPRNVGDDEVLFIYGNLLPSLVKGFRPELVLVAAGFDGLAQDPIGRSNLSPQGYVGLIEMIKQVVRENGAPPLLLALEGGYDVRHLADTVHMVLSRLSSSHDYPITPLRPSSAVEELTRQVRTIHEPLHIWL